MLGHDLAPDFMTGLKEGGFYGWPYSYFGRNLDPRVAPRRPDLVARAIKPDYALGAHTSSLGIYFYSGDALPARYRGGAFVSQHGSWNREPRSGYKVVFVPFREGRPADAPEDFLTGFLSTGGDALGRPVAVTEDRTGALLVSDDVGDIVWRVAPVR
jgi:glucose/arabinose dehydrogenase